MKQRITLPVATVLLALPVASFAQLHIDGGGFHISAGATVAVRGDVTSNGTDITGDGILLLNGTSAQNLGMNGGDVPVLEVNNPNNVTLTSAARIEDGLTFTAGHVLLGNNTLIFDPSAAAVGAATTKHLVTNGTGFVQKEDLANAASFTFPIGQAAGDLTQAVVTNNDPAVRDFNAQVKTYAQSAPTEGNPLNGVDRTWQIFADAAASATLQLQHNASSEGPAFTRDQAFIAQQTSTPGVWTAGTPAAATTPLYTHTRAVTVPGSSADPTSFFTKSDDVNNPVAPVIASSPKVFLQGAYNGTAMTTTLNNNNLIPLTQPYGVAPFNYAGTESVAAIPAGVTDWILLELRDASNTILARRAAFVESDGDVVDLDGKPIVTFGYAGVASGNYNLGVKHRNHLGIRSSTTQSYVLNGASVAYDFTSSQGAAYQDPSITTNPAQKDFGNGKFGMYGGNGAKGSVAGLNTVRATGAAAINDYTTILTTLGGAAQVGPTYTDADYNMNGTVRATGAASINDYTFLLGVLGSNVVITSHQ